MSGMAVQARGFRALRVYLEMVKIEHSVFALPFAMVGMLWAAMSQGRLWPTWWSFGWIVAAMVSCRSAAMAYNRIADRDIDAANPRTKMRAIPAGILSLRHANLFFFGSCAVFFVAAGMLNPLALALSPVALGVTLFYSRTKRFTPLSHYFLGLSLGIAPTAAWVGVTGRLDRLVDWAIVPMTVGVLLWTAGFDIIYSLQDEEFDKEHRLRSLPETLGGARALAVSRWSHVGAVLCMALSTGLVGAGPLSFAGIAAAACLLAYEQSLVKPNDLSRVNTAFFTLNGFVSLGIFAFVLADRLTAAL